MRFSVAKSGWVVLVHHLETVVWFTPNCSANHLLVLFFLTNTSFYCQYNAFDANIVILHDKYIM